MTDHRLDALITRARRLATTGSAEEAEEAESVNLAILGLDPDNLGALRRLGKICKDRGDQDAAIAYYRRTLQLAPEDTIAKHQLERLQGGAVRSIPARVDASAAA